MKPKFFIPALASLVIAFAIFVSCSEYESNVLDSGLDSGSAAYLGGFIVDPCGDVTEVPLCAGQNEDIGTITVANNNDLICVTYTITNTDWYIVETHLALEMDPGDFSQTKRGNPKVGKFPYGDTFNPGVTEAEYCFALGAFGYQASDWIYIAAHAAVQTVGGQEETAWGNGCTGTSFPGNNWATYFYHVVQECDPLPPGCESDLAGDYRTQTQGQWGATCSVENLAACYLADNFEAYFSEDLEVGNCVNPTYTVTYTNPDSIEVALPTGGVPGVLTTSHTDPTCDEDPGCQVSNAGALLGQVVALTLNVRFDLETDFISYHDINLADLVVCDESSPVYGLTVQEVLNEANKALGGCGSGIYTIWEIYTAVTKINENFLDGEIDACFLCLPCYDEWIVYGSKRGSSNSDLTTGDIYAIDLNTMTATLLYHPGISTGTQNWPNGNAYDPDNQRFYFTTNPGQLYFYELDATVHVSAGAIIGAVACGSFYDGKYYYIQEGTDDLHAVSFDGDGYILTDVILTDITNNVSKFNFGDIAISSDGLLYGSGSRTLVETPTTTYSEFYTIDLTGSSPSYSYNVIGNAVGQIAFGSDGVLYAHSAGAGTFYTVNLENGALSSKGCTTGGCLLLTDLASGPLCYP